MRKLKYTLLCLFGISVIYNVAFAQKENTKKIKETPYEKVTDLKKLETATKDAYFSEGFEVEFPPAGWVLSPNAGDDWAQDNGTDFGPGAPYEGELCIFFNDYDYTAGTTASITTPGIDLSDENDISAFSVPGQIGNEVIGNHTIAIVVSEGTDLSASVATFSISSEATIIIDDIEQVSGTTANDFTSSVTYIVTAENGDEQAWVVTITPNTSVNDIALDEYFTVYPNPTKNKINVSSYYSIDKVEIYSAIGNLLITNEEYVDGINVSELTEGVYFVRITSENNIITKRVFISK